MKRSTINDVAVFVGLVALGAASRVIQEYCPLVPPNFHAVAASALLAGIVFRSALVAACVPIAAMTLSNLVLEAYSPIIKAAVYGSLVMPIVWRNFLRTKLTFARGAVSAVSCSVFFFVVTNFVHWCCTAPQYTAARFWACYARAVPFFGYTLAGDLAYSAVLLGAFALLTSRARGARRVARPLATV